MRKPILSIMLAVMLILVSCGDKEAHMKKIKEEVTNELNTQMENEKEALKEIVRNFYQALSTTPNDNTAAGVSEWMAIDWKSTPTPAGGADMEGFVKTLFMFHGMIPDLKLDVQEMLVDGNQVIVRSIASGTPNSPEGYFFGTPTDGTKKFEVMTIDIHTVEDGKMVSAHHVEDWLTAVGQVGPSKE